MSSDWVTSAMNIIHAPGWLRTLFDHNRFTAVGLLASIGLLINITGCQPTVISPISGQKVTETQLTTEVETRKIESAADAVKLQAETDELINQLKTKYKARQTADEVINQKLGPAYAEIKQKQDAIHASIDVLSGLATASGNPVAGAAVGILGILAAGLGLDNRRKDRVIEKQPVDPALAVLDDKLRAANLANAVGVSQATTTAIDTAAVSASQMATQEALKQEVARLTQALTLRNQTSAPASNMG